MESRVFDREMDAYLSELHLDERSGHPLQELQEVHRRATRPEQEFSENCCNCCISKAKSTKIVITIASKVNFPSQEVRLSYGVACGESALKDLFCFNFIDKFLFVLFDIPH